ncbi:MAG: hypothetical protein HKN17_06630 [Rhodothermales bacterium]|nr:hypothetical protein [Rhodothermales bacterium]
MTRIKEAIKWIMNRHGGRIRADHASRHDLQSIPMGENARLDVYWKHLEIGLGPAVSVVIRGEEILRIDCFGVDDGHMHTAVFMPGSGESRLYFPENTRREQIDRAVFEIARNLRYWMDRAVDPGVRAVTLHPNRIKSAAADARRIMTAYLERVDERPAQSPAV